MTRAAVALIVSLAGFALVACEPTVVDGVDGSQSAIPAAISAASSAPPTPGSRRSFALPPIHGHSQAPNYPRSIGPASRPALVLITAAWCQYCQLLEHEVLPTPGIQKRLEASWDFLVADADRAPAWMDVRGLQGLPGLVFFDLAGRHVLTRSGYRGPVELSDLLDVMKKRIAGQQAKPYADIAELPRLPEKPLTLADVRKTLKRLESQTFIAVNDNDGGFATPARHPHPDLLHELWRFKKQGAPARVGRWVDLTVKSALMGRSPRLDGKPLDDFSYSAAALASLATAGPESEAWRSGVTRLPESDPYQGIQDPIDHGVFRYAAGPGWYHPHFERRALDNLSWVLLLRARGETPRATKIARYVDRAFLRGKVIGAVQRTQPFYYRLLASERARVAMPGVVEVWALDVQARAARVDRRRCAALDVAGKGGRWPTGFWTEKGLEQPGQEASADAVGELLLAQMGCGQKARARELLEQVLTRWAAGKLPPTTRPGRLFPLARGVCAVDPGEACGRALAAVSGLRLDVDFAPPYAELAMAAGEKL